jgi:hypothetical protein
MTSSRVTANESEWKREDELNVEEVVAGGDSNPDLGVMNPKEVLAPSFY